MFFLDVVFAILSYATFLKNSDGCFCLGTWSFLKAVVGGKQEHAFYENVCYKDIHIFVAIKFDKFLIMSMLMWSG